jgi:predicted amidohydrolase
MLERETRIAAAAIHSLPGQPAANLELMAPVCRNLKSEGVELILFPELSLSGFLPNHPVREHEPWLRVGLKTVRNWAEPIPGPSVRGLLDLAEELGCFISAGLFEDAGSLVHNTQVLAGPGGFLHLTRKMHIPIFEAPFYNGGGPSAVAQTPLGRVGTAICFDTLLPESTRLLAIQDPDLVLFPFASDPDPKTVEGWFDNNAPLLRIRCLENGFFGLAVNQNGPVSALGEEMYFPGGGFFLGPRGQVLAQWKGETAFPGTLIVDLDPTLLEEARSHPEFGLRFRRPELYRGLADPGQ